MICPCNNLEDEIKCDIEICPHISPRRGWVDEKEQIDLFSELVKFSLCDSKNKAKTLVNQGAVRIWDGNTWNKTEKGDHFLPLKETFIIVGKKKTMCHFLIPKKGNL